MKADLRKLTKQELEGWLKEKRAQIQSQTNHGMAMAKICN